jgi:hypothetical protein
MSFGRAKLLALCAFGLTLVVDAQTTKLDRFVGKDLRNDPREQRRLENIIGIAPKPDILGPMPWNVWKTKLNGGTRYIVLLVESETIIPGDSTACVALFGASAKRIASWCFPTGHRMTPASASIEFSNDAGSDLIVIGMEQFINGRDVASEYFGLGDDRLRLVRLENHKGEAVQNEYVYPDSEIGLAPSATTVEEWAGMLESGDKAVVLSALTFLGGRHLTEPSRHFASEPQESKNADEFQKLIGSPRIRELIEDLTKSGNAWIRQAAVLAARGPRERLPW